VSKGVNGALSRDEVDYLLAEIPLAIQQTLEGTERVSRIVRALKLFSHPGARTMSTFDVKSASESAVAVAQNEWKYTADIITDFGSDVPALVCLTDDMNQVFLNLIVNAAHAVADVVKSGMIQRGTITISTRKVGDDVEIRFADTGTGIPIAIQGKVFDLFFTTKEPGRGTGQGLALAHSVVVDKHNGSISFETQEGVGTTFTIRLPNRSTVTEVEASLGVPVRRAGDVSRALMSERTRAGVAQGPTPVRRFDE
jgi:signal transduction histidine kinase